MERLRIMLAAGAGVALVCAAAGSASATAGGAAAAHPRTAMAVAFMMKNGNHYSPGQPNPVAGNPIIQTTAPGRIFTFSNSTSVDGFQAGTLELANGNFMAANDACTGVTIKSNSGSNGTIWYIIPGTTGVTVQLASRYCRDTNGNNVIIYGDNTSGDQWKFCEAGPVHDTCGPGEFYNLVETEFAGS